MADDTVEAAKQQIVDDAYDGDCTKAQLIEHLDALIAAVRAEMQEAIDTKDRAHAMAIDREFALADKLEAALAETERVTRIEVIDENGRAYGRWDTSISLSFQDDGRTLKVFIPRLKTS